MTSRAANPKLDRAFDRLARTLARRIEAKKRASEQVGPSPASEPEWIQDLTDRVIEKFADRMEEIVKEARAPAWHGWVANFLILVLAGLFLSSIDQLVRSEDSVDEPRSVQNILPLSPPPRGKGR